MSWSINASGHAEDPATEAALLRDLKDIFARYHEIILDLSGNLDLASVKPAANVVDFGATPGAEAPPAEPTPVAEPAPEQSAVDVTADPTPEPSSTEPTPEPEQVAG